MAGGWFFYSKERKASIKLTIAMLILMAIGVLIGKLSDNKNDRKYIKQEPIDSANEINDSTFTIK